MLFGTFLIAVGVTAFFCTVTVIVFLSPLASVIVILALPVLLAALMLHVPVLCPVMVISFLLLLVQDLIARIHNIHRKAGLMLAGTGAGDPLGGPVLGLFLGETLLCQGVCPVLK